MERLLDWLLDRPRVDFALPILFVVLHLLLKIADSSVWTLADVEPAQRGLIYGALATVAALGAGSNNTAIGSYVGSSGPAMKKLRIAHGDTMRRALRSVGICMWAVTVTALLCLALDPLQKDSSTWGAEWVAEFALLVLVVEYIRLTFLQDLILQANDLSSQRENEGARRTTLTRRVKPTKG